MIRFATVRAKSRNIRYSRLLVSIYCRTFTLNTTAWRNAWLTASCRLPNCGVGIDNELRYPYLNAVKWISRCGGFALRSSSLSSSTTATWRKRNTVRVAGAKPEWNNDMCVLRRIGRSAVPGPGNVPRKTCKKQTNKCPKLGFFR